jgi:hypothetical protein
MLFSFKKPNAKRWTDTCATTANRFRYFFHFCFCWFFTLRRLTLTGLTSPQPTRLRFRTVPWEKFAACMGMAYLTRTPCGRSLWASTVDYWRALLTQEPWRYCALANTAVGPSTFTEISFLKLSLRHSGLDPIVPIRADEREYLGEIERGDQSWGFRPRRASLYEIVEANFAYIPSLAFELAITAFFGVAATLIIFAGLHMPQSTKGLNRLLWAGGLMLRLTFAAIAIVISLFFAALFGSTKLLWLASTVAGAMPALSLLGLFHTNRPAHSLH